MLVRIAVDGEIDEITADPAVIEQRVALFPARRSRRSCGHEMLEQIAVVARDAVNGARSSKIEALTHELAVAAGVLDPAVGTRGKICVFGEGLGRRDELLKLYERALAAHVDMPRVERSLAFNLSAAMDVSHSGDMPRSTNMFRRGWPQKRHLGEGMGAIVPRSPHFI